MKKAFRRLSRFLKLWRVTHLLDDAEYAAQYYGALARDYAQLADSANKQVQVLKSQALYLSTMEPTL